MSAFVLERKYALQLPNYFVDIDRDEMEYVDGGATSTSTGTAKYLKNVAATLMASWFSLAGGYTYATAAAVASTVGVGVGVIAGIGAGYCTFAGNEYRQAYNYFSTKSQTSSTQYKMTTISLIGIVTGVTYDLA